MELIELNPDYFKDLCLYIPESGNDLPEILVETVMLRLSVGFRSVGLQTPKPSSIVKDFLGRDKSPLTTRALIIRLLGAKLPGRQFQEGTTG